MRSGGQNSTILCILLMLMIPVSYTEAITNHDFQWRVEIGDRFDYHMSRRQSDSSGNKDLDYYIVLDDLPSIDENITDIPRIFGRSSVNDWNDYHSYYFMNDTEITSQTHVPTLLWSAFPIGNWSLIEEFVLAGINTTHWEVQVFDTETEWGLSFTSDGPESIYTETTKYSKENGVLTLFELYRLNSDETFYRFTITIVIEGIPLPLVIGVGGVSIGLLVIALVVFKKRLRLDSGDPSM